jgi:hypothetical protein
MTATEEPPLDRKSALTFSILLEQLAISRSARSLSRRGDGRIG